MSRPYSRPKSFVLRQGRITASQKLGLEKHLPGLAITDINQLNFNTIFKNNAPLILEIGFGMGDALVQSALNYPHLNFIGVEVHSPGVGHLAKCVSDYKISNIRVFHGDVFQLLSLVEKNHALSRIHIFFPDPWPKKRHHKRRLIQNDFIELALPHLKAEGIIHVATDVVEYAESIYQCLRCFADLEKIDTDPTFQRSSTKFEARGISLNHTIEDILYKKTLEHN